MIVEYNDMEIEFPDDMPLDEVAKVIKEHFEPDEPISEVKEEIELPETAVEEVSEEIEDTSKAEVETVPEKPTERLVTAMYKGKPVQVMMTDEQVAKYEKEYADTKSKVRQELGHAISSKR